MPLASLPKTDVEQLWAYFFMDNAKPWPLGIRESIHLAVFANADRIFLHWNDTQHSTAAFRNELLRLGARLLDSTRNFRPVLHEEPAQLTVDMQGNEHVYVVPFVIGEGVRRPQEVEVNAFVALYGGVNASIAALKFEELSRTGWGPLFPNLP
ncbi:MAG TPA: hypothetical protein VH349_03280 [Ktedonobacterales bacterium]